MKILVITRDFMPRTNGGISTSVGYEVEGLVSAGHQCTVVSFDGWRPVAGNGREKPALIDMSANPGIVRLSSPTAQNSAFNAARLSKPDVIHLHHSTLLDFALDLSSGKIPIIKTVHVLQHVMNRYRGLDHTMTGDTQAKAISECARIVVMSKSARNALVAEFPEAADKVHVIPPGIPDYPVAAVTKWPRPYRTCTYAGRFSDIKGTDLLFETARGLATDPRNHVVIAGGLPDSPASERRYMRKWERDSTGGDVSRVTFPGWLERNDLCQLLCRTSVYISPGVFETFGLSIAEAMLHQTPVVATACGGPEEIIENYRTGVIVTQGDPGAFINATKRLLDDPDLCAEMGRAARQSILDRFSLKTHTHAMTSAYHELI